MKRILPLLLIFSACEVVLPQEDVSTRARDVIAEEPFEPFEPVAEVPEDVVAEESCADTASCPSQTMAALTPFEAPLDFSWAGDGSYLLRRNSSNPTLADIERIKITSTQILLIMANGQHLRLKREAPVWPHRGGILSGSSINEFGGYYPSGAKWFEVMNPRWVSTHMAAVTVCVDGVYYCKDIFESVP